MIRDNNQPALSAWLIFTCLAAAGLRFWHLDFQSLWLDELYTMKECDPAISWAETFRLVRENECKSPLYYILVRLACTWFGYTGMVARGVSALAGVAGVYAVYQLGRELDGKRTGIVAAMITAVNPFHIAYSQEARGYALLFLFSAWSFLYFIRCLRHPRPANAVLHGVTSALCLHIHPFAALLPLSQAIVLVIALFSMPDRRKVLITFGVSGAVLLLMALPLVSDFRAASGISDFWVQRPEQSYFYDFIKEFFGNSDLLQPLIVLLLLGFVAGFYTQKRGTGAQDSSLVFLLVFITVLCSFLIPYLYSILKVPATVIRYFIGVLPLLICALAIGAKPAGNPLVKQVVLVAFLVVSLVVLVLVNGYYNRPSKTQFREMAEFVRYYSDRPYSINNQKTAWQAEYYMKHLGVGGVCTAKDNNAFIDSVLAAPQDQAFWLVGAHQDTKPEREKLRHLETRFVLTKAKDFYDAWALLYRPLNDGKRLLRKLDHQDFAPGQADRINGDSIVPLWDNSLKSSLPQTLPVGNYVLKVNSSGTPCDSIFPHIEVFKDDILIGEYDTQDFYGFSRPINFDVMPGDKPFVLRLRMTNDANKNTGEDRNALIKAIYIYKD